MWYRSGSAVIECPPISYASHGNAPVHACFNGPHVAGLDDRSRLVHTTYRDSRRHTSSPWWGSDGIRTRVGGMRHVPLAEFLNAFADAGLQLDHVAEPDEEPVPWGIVVLARRSTERIDSVAVKPNRS